MNQMSRSAGRSVSVGHRTQQQQEEERRESSSSDRAIERSSLSPPLCRQPTFGPSRLDDTHANNLGRSNRIESIDMCVALGVKKVSTPRVNQSITFEVGRPRPRRQRKGWMTRRPNNAMAPEPSTHATRTGGGSIRAAGFGGPQRLRMAEACFAPVARLAHADHVRRPHLVGVQSAPFRLALFQNRPASPLPAPARPAGRISPVV